MEHRENQNRLDEINLGRASEELIPDNRLTQVTRKILFMVSPNQ